MAVLQCQAMSKASDEHQTMKHRHYHKDALGGNQCALKALFLLSSACLTICSIREEYGYASVHMQRLV